MKLNFEMYIKKLRSDQLALPQQNITIYFMPHFWAYYRLILGGDANCRALVFFSKHEILHGKK